MTNTERRTIPEPSKAERDAGRHAIFAVSAIVGLAIIGLLDVELDSLLDFVLVPYAINQARKWHEEKSARLGRNPENHILHHALKAGEAYSAQRRARRAA